MTKKKTKVTLPETVSVAYTVFGTTMRLEVAYTPDELVSDSEPKLQVGIYKLIKTVEAQRTVTIKDV